MEESEYANFLKNVGINGACARKMDLRPDLDFSLILHVRKSYKKSYLYPDLYDLRASVSFAHSYVYVWAGPAPDHYAELHKAVVDEMKERIVADVLNS